MQGVTHPGSAGPSRRPRLLLLLALLLLLSACRSPNRSSDDGGPDGSDADLHGDGDGDADLDGDIGDVEQPDGLAPLALTSLQPSHGPFTGGTEVVLRGRGFTDGLTVWFGDRLVDPVDVALVDDNRVSVRTPPGDPGTVDVRMAFDDGEEVVLEEGFTYDAWYLDPSTGSVAGGTLITLLGLRAGFEPTSEITFGGVEAVEVTWVSSDEMSCRTPPGTIGGVDVEVTSSAGSTVVRDGFVYYDNADPRNGGLGGGPIDGTIDVTVLDGATSAPLADSFVILGTDADTIFQGRTDGAGRITFSDPTLSGRQSITASHAPVDVFDDRGDFIGQTTYESMTIIEFDASSVTILLEPVPPPQPGVPPPGRRGGYIEGELMFDHRGEFGPYEWDIVPEPEEGEVKVAYVYTTQSSVRASRMEPGVDGVVFNSADYIGVNGYRFRIYAAPGTVAVYAMAGLARWNEGAEGTTLVDFVPYVMGVARGVVVGPEETVRGVAVLMSRQMSVNVPVMLENAPLADESGTPNTYILDVYLDLGAEGVMSRPETQLRSTVPYGIFGFPGWVELTGNLAGASYTVVAGAWTTRGGSEEEQNPWSVVYRAGITDVEEPIVIDEFLAVPRALSPSPGGVMTDNHMEWVAEGGTTPHFSVATLTIPTGVTPVPYWMVVLRGGETAYDLPYLPELAEMPDYPTGDLNWQVWSFSVEEGFEFDTWSYRYLYSRYWTAYAVDSWYIRLSE